MTNPIKSHCEEDLKGRLWQSLKIASPGRIAGIAMTTKWGVRNDQKCRFDSASIEIIITKI